LLAFPGIPTVSELERLGVARLSVGTWPTLAAMSSARKIAGELLGAGTYESMFEGAVSYPEANRLMAARPNSLVEKMNAP
jgi:2-methylisocitrate lyase-like PEP mutase family enzyme